MQPDDHRTLGQLEMINWDNLAVCPGCLPYYQYSYKASCIMLFDICIESLSPSFSMTTNVWYGHAGREGHVIFILILYLFYWFIRKKSVVVTR